MIERAFELLLDDTESQRRDSRSHEEVRTNTRMHTRCNGTPTPIKGLRCANDFTGLNKSMPGGPQLTRRIAKAKAKMLDIVT